MSKIKEYEDELGAVLKEAREIKNRADEVLSDPTKEGLSESIEGLSRMSQLCKRAAELKKLIKKECLKDVLQQEQCLDVYRANRENLLISEALPEGIPDIVSVDDVDRITDEEVDAAMAFLKSAVVAMTIFPGRGMQIMAEYRERQKTVAKMMQQ